MADCVFHEDIKEQVADHEVRIQKIEIKEATYEADFKSICKRLDDLITVIKWAIGTTLAGMTAFVAFLQYIK